jgi:hypothetical protein
MSLIMEPSATAHSANQRSSKFLCPGAQKLNEPAKAGFFAFWSLTGLRDETRALGPLTQHPADLGIGQAGASVRVRPILPPAARESFANRRGSSRRSRGQQNKSLR